MIYKSYLIENNIEKIDKGITLFYGENLGLINDFKELIRKFNNNSEIIRYNEDEILKKNIIFFREISNKSLFNEKTIIFVNQVSDKITDLIEEAEKNETVQNIYLFSGILEKKSKLRTFFENSDKSNIVPCYEDNEISLKRIIQQNLRDFKGISTENVNIIIENCSLNRSRLKNELEKIRSFFLEKVLETEKLKKLLNLNSINQRLGKLLEINNNNDIEKAVNSLRPPIFWKDKPNFISQAKIWDQSKIKLMMKNTYNIEIKVKSNSSINKDILIKKLLIDICELANAS